MEILGILGSFISHFLMGLGLYTVIKQILLELKWRKERKAYEAEYGVKWRG